MKHKTRHDRWIVAGSFYGLMAHQYDFYIYLNRYDISKIYGC